MVSNAAEYEMRFLANVMQAVAEIRKMEKSVGASMDSISKAAKFAKKALAAVGIGLSAAAFAGSVRDALNAAEAAGKLAQKTGLATKDVAGLQLAFRLAGLESATL